MTANSLVQDTNKFSGQASSLADQAASSADSAIKSTQRATNSAFDSLAGGVQDLRQQAGPMIDRAASQATDLAQRGADTAQQLRERALRASDVTVNYIREEPVKAMLIAAATGAGLMALISLMTRSSDRR